MKDIKLISFVATLVTAFVLSALFTRMIIPKLKSLKLGQTILDIGPRWHKSKEGTPTMGGLAFIAAALISTLAAVCVSTYVFDTVLPIRLILSMVFASLSGAIGIFDDMTKFKNHRNEGLTASQKYILQVIVCALYLWSMFKWGGLTTALVIPFVNIKLELGIFYYVFALILLTGIINSVNLTDGIDGLASSVTMTVGAAFAVLSFITQNYDSTVLSALLIACPLGFLMYNFYPAKIFMGDTGSLFLGALVCATAFVLNNPLIVLVSGIIYVIESLSVIIQVTSFKLTGKRVFKMSPIHHHFEKCGWSEVKIVSVFSLVTLIFSVIVIATHL